MGKTVGEYKKCTHYSSLLTVFKNSKGKFHTKLIKGLKCVVWMKGIPCKDKLELFNATGAIERKFDDWYINYNYSQFYSWEETMEMLLVVEMIKEMEKNQYNEKDVYDLLSYCMNK